MNQPQSKLDTELLQKVPHNLISIFISSTLTEDTIFVLSHGGNMKTLLLIVFTLCSLSIYARPATPDEVSNIEFRDCGSTNARPHDVLAKFVMSAENEVGERTLTSSLTGEQFGKCWNIAEGIKCKLGFFKKFVLHYSKLKLRTDLDTDNQYYSIKSEDHVYQCNEF